MDLNIPIDISGEYRRLKRIAVRMAIPGVEADDLANSAALGLLNATQKENARVSRSYFRMRVHGAIIDEIRAEVRHSRRTDKFDEDGCAFNGSVQADGVLPSQESDARSRECRMLLEGVLSMLPVDDQKLIRMRYLGDVSGQRIAKEFEISPATVVRWHERALRRMRKLLADRGITQIEELF